MDGPASWISGKKREERDLACRENAFVPEAIIQRHGLRGAARNTVLRNLSKARGESHGMRDGPSALSRQVK